MALTAAYVVSLMMVSRDTTMPRSLGSPLTDNGWAGLGLHFVIGTVIFPLVYAFFLHGVLPGADAVKGITSGILFWLFAQTVVMPVLGAGFFSTRTGGLMASMIYLIGHLAYGTLLGWIAGSTKPSTAPG